MSKASQPWSVSLACASLRLDDHAIVENAIVIATVPRTRLRMEATSANG